ncbi:uncharacterized protein LOC121404136 [Drosophila obscura]|uniref:uncharacterized protein LOC121404136 n=1 Tax=Drosophila obscura TaxID=7282 RepID=UPI001BB1136F|nr:uncharacterized protein LOC121404136 [Drosophila obscura]
MESLASKEEVADCIIVQTVLQKLDKASQNRWEESSSNQELPSWEKLSGFLEKRCRTLENVDQGQGQDGQVGKSGKTVKFTTSITAVVAQKITDHQPSITVSTASWPIPSNIQLADPSFHKPQRIDLLIGAGLFFELLCVGQIQLAPGLPLLQKTHLGWIISGGGHSALNNSSFIATQSSDDINHSTRLDELVRQFWEVEHIFEPIVRATKEELHCEDHFVKHHTRLPSGEYSVSLPMKRSLESLGDSYLQAKRRLENLERKFVRNPVLYSKYSAFMKDHMSLVPNEDRHKCRYFLPHHCVIKEDSSTTKLRVVFDGSAVTTSGVSLNDLLMSGPTIQSKLFHTLLRFRTFSIALTGDIGKMYRCVRVSMPDTMLQCILWRDSVDDDIKIFKLNTVTYGTKPASFLAIRAMHQLAMDESSSYPLGSETILQDFYVDDMISGGNSVEEVLDIMRQTTELLACGNFQLRKWCSNSPDVLREVPEAERESFLKLDDGSDVTKALGLIWEPQRDNFLFTFAPQIGVGKHTKRSVLSTIARCYDPMGLIGPTLTRAKIIMQRMWRDKLHWDESLPQPLESAWTEFCKDFATVGNATFPRYILQPKARFELHAFCDASLQAYGACIYARSFRDTADEVHLLCSKARVAPLKTLTVPKLELCAAFLLANLLREIRKIDTFDCPIHCWSDSTVVLSWLREEPSKFNVFVSNKISAIQQLTRGMDWRYVPTEMNPADILSKGAAPQELLQSRLWMNGPSFLQGERSSWPERCSPELSLPEIRHRVLLSSGRVDISLSFKHINSFGVMMRIFGYVHKFVSKKRSPDLSSEDLRKGSHLLCRIVQRAHLYPEYRSLRKGNCVESSSSIISLSPFIDDVGLIRVGGRLRHSTLGFDARHPIILPRDHPLTFAIIIHFHRKHHHAGPQSLLGSIRLQFWPIGGMKTVARALRKCIICCRSRPRLVEHIMADLPKDRVQDSPAFSVTGIDYCGPFYYKPDGRTRTPTKCYISVFICFATNAVWLELVKDLTTAGFLSALKRFVATRGIPRCIWSDNATNFVGARNELEDLRRLFMSEKHRDAVHNHCINNGFNWKFIPPRSPHFGGLWEAAVKMAKQHLYRSLGSSLFGFDELRTLVCQIQAAINSRPLLAISENPEDLGVLKPGHFLIGRPLMEFPEPDVTNLNFNRLDCWQRVACAQQIFWKRWSEEYLTLLQQRAKWRTPQPSIQVNDIVCIKDENLPPLKWPLARVIDIIAGADGTVRVAVLKTPSGTTRRAVNKLCVLPVEDPVKSLSLSTGGSIVGAAADNRSS